MKWRRASRTGYHETDLDRFTTGSHDGGSHLCPIFSTFFTLVIRYFGNFVGVYRLDVIYPFISTFRLQSRNDNSETRINVGGIKLRHLSWTPLSLFIYSFIVLQVISRFQNGLILSIHTVSLVIVKSDLSIHQIKANYHHALKAFQVSIPPTSPFTPLVLEWTNTHSLRTGNIGKQS